MNQYGERLVFLAVELSENLFSIVLEIYLAYYLEGFFFNVDAFVNKIVLEYAFPNLGPFRNILPWQYFFHDFADDDSGGGVEIIIEEQYFTVALIIDLLRLLA